jgi:hypothetical protein
LGRRSLRWTTESKFSVWFSQLAHRQVDEGEVRPAALESHRRTHQAGFRVARAPVRPGGRTAGDRGLAQHGTEHGTERETKHRFHRKGYDEKLELAFGLLLRVIGLLSWLVWRAKPDSRWKLGVRHRAASSTPFRSASVRAP